VDTCPQQAIVISGDTRIIDWGKCNNCMKCAEVCRARAIEVTGKYMTVAEVVDIVGKDASYYRRTKGGVTLSGGEPLLQWRFALEILREAKRKGWHTALDTTGYADWEVLEGLLNYTDLVLYDVKHMNSARHQEGTGKANELVLDNLQKTVGKPRVKVWVRRTVIPNFNDYDEDLEELSEFVLILGTAVEKVSLLPYHKFGELKYVAMGRAYPYRGVPLISDERIQVLKKLVESHGIKVDVGR
jgi:pyruvate formate lyase activating enzyme